MRWVFWSLCLSLFFAGTAAAEIVCVKSAEATLSRSPTASRSPAVLVVPQNYPLQVEAVDGSHAQVRDYWGRRGWIRTDLVAKQPGVVVVVGLANVRRGPGLNHPLTFKAKEGVAFKLLARDGSWLHVLHQNGRKGWIHRNLTWGRIE